MEKNRTSFSEQLNINRIFHEEFNNNQKLDQDHTVYYRKKYTFSDCAYIFYGYKYKDGVKKHKKNLGKLFTTALCNCEPIFLRFLKEHIIFRGGADYGEAYIDKKLNMFFGKAVNKAYIMESSEAIHPRILVDNIIANKLINNVKEVSYQIAAHDSEAFKYLGMNLIPKYPLTGDGIIEKDIDGRYIVNYFHLLEYGFTVGDSIGAELFDDLIEYCQEQIKSNDNIKVIDKYLYLKNFCLSKKMELINE